MVAATETKKTEVIALPTWCAVIYLAGLEAENDGKKRRARGLMSNVIPPALRLFQVELPVPKNHREGMPLPMKAFHLLQGTNLGVFTRGSNDIGTIDRILTADWEAIAQQPINAHLIKIGALEVIYPATPDEVSEPRYRHFSSEDALKLIEYHQHTMFIDRALVGEKRPEILTAAEERKVEILEEERRMQSGVW